MAAAQNADQAPAFRQLRKKFMRLDLEGAIDQDHTVRRERGPAGIERAADRGDVGDAGPRASVEMENGRCPNAYRTPYRPDIVG